MQTSHPPQEASAEPLLTIETNELSAYWIPKLNSQLEALDHFSHNAPDGVPEAYYDEAYISIKMLADASVLSIKKHGGLLLIGAWLATAVHSWRYV